MTVMDKVEGWNEEKRVVSKFAASVWNHTKAVLFDGRGRDPLLDLKVILRIIMESVSWVTEDILWEHERITETNVVLKERDILEALNYDIDVPCSLQWRLLWFSAPSSLNRKLVNNRTKVAKFRDTANSATEKTCNIAFDGTHTPRAWNLRAGSIFLSYAPDKDWNLQEEMKGWGVGEGPLSTQVTSVCAISCGFYNGS